MTPTLLGRWQIRIFLLATVGLLISLIVYLIVKNTVPLFALLYVLLFGLVWDVIYQFITSFRWDRDWPTCFQVAAGVIEGALVWGLILTKKLPGIPEPPPFVVFLIQYAAIWLSIFVLTQGPLRVFWLKWRYQGGQWFISRRKRAEDYTYQQQPVPALQGVGEYKLQQPVAPPQLVHTSNPERRQSPGDPARLQPLQPLRPQVCACGFASDRVTGNFCPQCGRPKVQQGVS
jgi:hypothetical protein